MGYMETRKKWEVYVYSRIANRLGKRCSEVFGDLISPTGECYPYNNFTDSSVKSAGIGRLSRRRQSRQRSQQKKQKCPEQKADKLSWLNFTTLKAREAFTDNILTKQYKDHLLKHLHFWAPLNEHLKCFERYHEEFWNRILISEPDVNKYLM